MKEFLDSMIKVQDLDRQLYALKMERELRPKIMADQRASLERLQKKLLQKKDDIKLIRKEIDKRNGDLKSVEVDLKKHQDMLNIAKSNKEYQIIKDKMSELNKSIGDIEQDMLTKMDNIEAEENELKKSQEEIQRKENELKIMQAKVDGEQAGLDKQIADLKAQRDILTPGIPKDVLITYERIADRNKGIGLVPVKSGVCQGCFRMLNAQEINRLMAAKDLMCCVQCGRIEYLT